MTTKPQPTKELTVRENFAEDSRVKYELLIYALGPDRLALETGQTTVPMVVQCETMSEAYATAKRFTAALRPGFVIDAHIWSIVNYVPVRLRQKITLRSK